MLSPQQQTLLLKARGSMLGSMAAIAQKRQQLMRFQQASQPHRNCTYGCLSVEESFRSNRGTWVSRQKEDREIGSAVLKEVSAMFMGFELVSLPQRTR
jgi:hypothetical protein